ncbi:hypothetical protein ACS7SF_21055 (plasmid) [Ralstonia sp. 25C]|uniref:hypothetical protein n=1 Tax=Ralstonia sp. 25C TaxID=3447363 RepID=UPI003F754D2B
MVPMSTPTLAVGLVLLLLLMRWRQRVALRKRREQAEQETKLLALLLDENRFTDQPMEHLVQTLGSNYVYTGLDFGQFALEWKAGTLRVVASGKETICESVSVERVVS